MANGQTTAETGDRDALRICLAGADDVLAWSSGEVTQPTTFHPRSGRPERGGLFCELVFGPVRNWVCRCGLYHGQRHDGRVCERCGTPVLHSRVRRQRLGHIELAAPVVHPWFLRARPSPLALLLGLRGRELEAIVYGQAWVVRTPGKAPVTAGAVLDPPTCQTHRRDFGPEFAALTGAEAVEFLLTSLKLDELAGELRAGLAAAETEPQRKALVRRLHVVEALRRSGNRPEALILRRLPVVPPDLRPMVRLASGRYATSELNDLYRRLIHRNNRLRRMLPLNPPERILLNERRMIQQAVDAVLDNGHCRRPIPGRGGRPLRSLTDLLTGKHGRFRANLLGKRVDYSARAVIVVGPELQLHQCGLPRTVALELYEPFLVRRLLREGLARTIGKARQMLADLQRPGLIAHKSRLVVRELAREAAVNHARRVLEQARGLKGPVPAADLPRAAANAHAILDESETPAARRAARILHEVRPATALEDVRGVLREMGPAAAFRRVRALLEGRLWKMLEEVTRGHPVLLNRAPTLHRPGIQAFEPVLVDGNALRLHPLVCKAFNADFDGDQMAVHLPLSLHARIEASVLLMSTHNLFNPANGQPLVTPSQDVVLGCHYLTATLPEPAAPAPAPPDALPAFHPRPVPPPPADFAPPATDRGKGRTFASPEEVIQAYDLGKVGVHAAVEVRLPAGKVVVDEAHAEPGQATAPPRGRVATTVGRVVFNALLPAGMPFYNWTLNAARLGRVVADCHRLIGPRTTVELLDLVKQAGFRAATRSGLSFATDDLPLPAARPVVLQATQKKVDTLRTALRHGNITEEEYALNLLTLWTAAQKQVADRLLTDLRHDHRGGRPYLNPLFAMADSGARGNRDQVRQLAGMRGLMASVSGKVVERSIVASLREGLPTWDYFLSAHGARKGLGDKGLRTADAGYLTRKLIDVAQHVVVRGDDCRTPRGIVKRVPEDEARTGLTLRALVRGRVSRETVADAEGRVVVRENEVIGEAQAARLEALGLEEVQVRSPLTCDAAGGVCRLCYGLDLATGRLAEEGLAAGVLAAQSIGEPGTQLTLRTFHIGGVAGKDIVNDLERIARLLEASPPAASGLDLEELLAEEGPDVVADYLIDEVRAVYRHHGLEIDDKHLEVIVAQLLRKVRVVSPGATDLLPDQVIDRHAFREANARLTDPDAPRATCRPHLLGLTRAAVGADSFLAGASFQRTVDVLAEAALAGRVDLLTGLKENVMLGRLVPAGTGSERLRRAEVRERRQRAAVVPGKQEKA